MKPNVLVTKLSWYLSITLFFGLFFIVSKLLAWPDFIQFIFQAGVFIFLLVSLGTQFFYVQKFSHTFLSAVPILLFSITAIKLEMPIYEISGEFQVIMTAKITLLLTLYFVCMGCLGLLARKKIFNS